MTVECHQCEACTDALLKQDENAKRSVHRNWCTCLQCVDNRRKHRHWSLNAAFDTHRLLITKLKERRRPAYAKPNTRQRRTQHLWNKGPLKATVGNRAERIPIVRVYSRVNQVSRFHFLLTWVIVTSSCDQVYGTIVLTIAIHSLSHRSGIRLGRLHPLAALQTERIVLLLHMFAHTVQAPRKRLHQTLSAVIPGEQWERLCRNEGVYPGTLSRYEPARVSLVGTPRPTELHITPRAEDRDSAWVILRKPGDQDATQFYSRALDASTLAQQGMVYAQDGSFCSGSVLVRSGEGGLSALIVEQNINHWESGRIAARRRVVVHYRGRELSALSLYRELDQSDYVSERPRAKDFVRLLETGRGAWQGRAAYVYARDQRKDAHFNTEASLSIEELSMDGVDAGVPAVVTRVAAPGFERVSRGRLDESQNKIVFDPIHPNLQYQMRFLGRDCTVLAPHAVPLGQAFLVEFTWLVRPGLRRRIVRQYDSDGMYEGSVFIEEIKQP